VEHRRRFICEARFGYIDISTLKGFEFSDFI